MTDISQFQPTLMWKHFADISKIPHCSKQEERIREHIRAFAMDRNLVWKEDDTGNIVIYKPGTPGFEDAPSLALQGHMDMVCEKNNDTVHDFEKDPITFRIDGEWLYANGTTLGADDGIGVASCMAILDDDSLVHGPLECLFTVDEETGLTGAFGLARDLLTAKNLINLDSEDLGVFSIGCAGGGDSHVRIPLGYETLPAGWNVHTVKIEGLRGGHSGVQIHENRKNAIKFLTRILFQVGKSTDYRLAMMDGGDKHNAIPREALAYIAVPPGTDLGVIITPVREAILEEITSPEPGVQITIMPIHVTKPDAPVLDKASTTKLIDVLLALPDGVAVMSHDVDDFVETSNNLATIKITEGEATMLLSCRSSIMGAIRSLQDRILAVTSLAGGEVKEGNGYPGWKPNPKSALVELCRATYVDLFGKEPKVEAIHAGLECGLIGEKYPGMDMVSIGPDIQNPHSPEERVRVESVKLYWDHLVEVIARLAKGQ